MQRIRTSFLTIFMIQMLFLIFLPIGVRAEETVENQGDDPYFRIQSIDGIGTFYEEGYDWVCHLYCKQKYQVNIETNLTTGQITYQTGDPSVATVDSKGVITAVGYGITLIRAYNSEGYYSDTQYIRVVSQGFSLEGTFDINTCGSYGTVFFPFRAVTMEGIDISRNVQVNDSDAVSDVATYVTSYDEMNNYVDTPSIYCNYNLGAYSFDKWHMYYNMNWSDGYNDHWVNFAVTVTKKAHTPENGISKSDGISAATTQMICKECHLCYENIEVNPISYQKKKNKLVVYGGTLTRTDAYGALLESRAITLKEGVDYTVDIVNDKYRITFTDQCPYYKGRIKTWVNVLDNVYVKSFRSSRKNTATVSFKAVKQADGYEIMFARNKRFTKNANTIKTKKTSFIFAGLKGGKKYYVKVRAYKKIKNKTVYSPWTGYYTTTTKKSKTIK